MNIKLLFPIGIFALISCTSSRNNVSLYKDIINVGDDTDPYAKNVKLGNAYGPYNRESNDETWKIIYNTNVSLTYEYIRFYDEKGLIFAERTSASDNHTYTSSVSRMTALYTFKPSQSIRDKKVTIYITVFNASNNQSLIDVSTYFTPSEEKTIRAKDYQINELQLTDTLVSLPHQTTYDETYSFKDTSATFLCEEYYTLYFDGVHFDYLTGGGKSFSCQKAYLSVEDKKGYFKNFLIDDEVRIPLVTFFNNNQVTFGFNGSLYYDPETLIMASSLLYGYQKCDVFYLPKNGVNDINGEEFVIHMIGCGRNKINIDIGLTYYASKNRFGNCDSASYCIIGEIEE